MAEPNVKQSDAMQYYEDVIRPDSFLTWFTFTSLPEGQVTVNASGSGGIEELQKSIKDLYFCLGFIRINSNQYGLISYISLDVQSERIISISLKMTQQAKSHFLHHYFLDVTKVEDITLENLKMSSAPEEAYKPSSVTSGDNKKKKKKLKGENGEEAEKLATKKKKEDLSAKASTLTEDSEKAKKSKVLKKKTHRQEISEDLSEDLTDSSEKKKGHPSIEIIEAPIERKPSVRKKTEDLLLVQSSHKQDMSWSGFSHHSRDFSASSDTSDDRYFVKAIAHHLAKADDELMFLKGDIIQVIERTSKDRWLGSCSDLEGYFNPEVVEPLPSGFRSPREHGASGSEHSETQSDSDDDEESEERPAEKMNEQVVTEWLCQAGFPQYVDMHQKNQIIDEEEVKNLGFLKNSQIQSLLKRIQFLNQICIKQLSETSMENFPKTQEATPISPNWNDSQSAEKINNWGESLTRSKSKKKKKIRSIHELEPHELDIARKLAVLSVTAMLEKRSNNRVQNFALKTLNKMVGKKEDKHHDKRVFGVDLAELVERTGVSSKWTHGNIPKCLYNMFEALEKDEMIKTVGLFRVPGKQTRIQQAKEQCDACGGDMSFSSLTGAELTGLIKAFFKDLPDSLFTSELYKSYLSVASMSNKRVQIENLQLLSILLPKENRDLAACLLKFLSMVSTEKDSNKMDAVNLSLVLAPTLFGDRRSSAKSKPVDKDKDLQRQQKIGSVLQIMIECQSVLWVVPVDLQDQLEYTSSQGNKNEKKKRWFFSTKYPTL